MSNREGPEVGPDPDASEGGEPTPERTDGGAAPSGATQDGGDPADERTRAERDWDAEWRSITSDLTPPRRSYLVSDTPVVGAAQGPRDYTPAEDPDEDAFIPVPLEHAPMDRATRIAWTAIVAGPVLMLLAVVAFDRAPTWYVATCLGIFLTGCVIGFTRLPARREDDGGDGAAL